jgi:hypothetical protein
VSADNPGFMVLNDAPCGAAATIAATGLGRSGTTMLARVMIDLGVAMPGTLTPKTAEDKDIQTLLKNGDLKGFGRLCRERDSAFPVWGLKCPALRDNLVEAAGLMRAPRLIVVFRDALAIAMRNVVSMQSDRFEALRTAASGTLKLVDRVGRAGCPVLLISYEKALLHPVRTVDVVASFCGLAPDRSAIASIAARCIDNEDPRYRHSAVDAGLSPLSHVPG